MLNKILFWLNNSRLFSLPMTLLSWFVIFIYCLKLNGNIINGLLALVGISCAHLATNLFDDFMDYKNLPPNSQVAKCAYIKEGKATINDVLKVVIIYLSIASLVGLYLLIKCGLPVLFLALIGGIITLIYSKLSERGFSEIAVGIAFGPLFFEGVCFVMTGMFSFEVLIMSLAIVMFTIGLMYVHTILDFEGDMYSHKKTLACRLKSKDKAIDGIFVLYGLAYLFTTILALSLKNYFIFSTLFLIPLVFDMHKSLKSFTCGGEKKEFYKRLLKPRNLMVYYCILIILSFII